MSDRENPSEQDKSSEKQMIVQGLLFLFVLVPAVFIIASIVFADFVAQTPPSRSLDDAAKKAKIAACESEKGYKNTQDCYK